MYVFPKKVTNGVKGSQNSMKLQNVALFNCKSANDGEGRKGKWQLSRDSGHSLHLHFSLASSCSVVISSKGQNQ